MKSHLKGEYVRRLWRQGSRVLLGGMIEYNKLCLKMAGPFYYRGGPAM
jgi:hypothetical protein